MQQEINATKRTDIYQIYLRNVDVVAGFNVRREFAIDELKEQIKFNGVLNPITVIPTKLHRAASKPHRAKPYWHRTRSFCVRKGYH